jgi:hypothetical protein
LKNLSMLEYPFCESRESNCVFFASDLDEIRIVLAKTAIEPFSSLRILGYPN